MSQSAETDLMKNLSAHEKRRLMRQIDQASAKRTTPSSRPSGANSKNYHITPMPFNGGATKATQPTKSFVPWNSNIGNGPSSFVSGRNYNPVIKPVRAPDGKSTKGQDVVVPQLNPDHVKLFTSQEAIANSKAKQASKPQAFNSRMSSATKMNPSTRAASPSNNSSVSNFNAASNNSNPKQSNFHNSHAIKQLQITPPPQKSASPVFKLLGSAQKTENPVASPQSNMNSGTTGASANSANYNASSNSRDKASPRPMSPKSISASKPTSPWQSRASLLGKDTSQVSPPTAVVAPMREGSKVITSSAGKKDLNSSEAARNRSVSSPMRQQKSQNDVNSLQNSSDKSKVANVPGTRSAPLPATKIKRSLSAASKVAPKSKLGHNFQPHELKEWVNWCDACGSVILSLFGKCVSCTKCRMICHSKCALSVSLTCEADDNLRSLTLNDSDMNLYKTIVQETKDESTLKEYNTIQRVITFEEIQKRIEDFNHTVRGSQQMTLQDDGETFRGFIRVSMNLTRPVSVMDTSKTTRKPLARKSSFYIDKGALKALHLTSDTTGEQVVEALLMKYSISDNPMKFALFEKQFREEGHVILRKMLPKERPLFLRLLWGNGNSDKRGFILQENESRDIHWESFSVAELHMFMKILQKEENDYILDIKRKYKNKSKDIKMAIDHQKKRIAT